jgi:serine protease AprX
MLKIRIILLLTGLLFVLPFFAGAQQWMVYFKDKQRNDFNPYTYFDAKAIERRINTGIAVDDPSDWPVNAIYIDEVTISVNEVLMSSRWLNAVAVDADEIQINNIRQLPFVLGVEWIEPSQVQITALV